MYERRLQILIDEQRYRRIEAAARRRKVSVATVIREAIDLALPDDAEGRRAAGRRILAATRIPVPHPDQLRRERDEARWRGL